MPTSPLQADSSLPSPKECAISQIMSTINEGAKENFQEGI